MEIKRDKHGIEPLYYTLVKQTPQILWSSNIKALLRLPNIKAKLDLEALVEYFTFQNIMSDKTLFKGISLLPAGCYLDTDDSYKIKRYWSYDLSFSEVKLPYEVAVVELKRLLKQVANKHLKEGEFGCYLSGGLDSSCIASMFPNVAFTCGFDLSSVAGDEKVFDERKYAEMVSSKFGIEHYEVILHSNDMEKVMPGLIYILEDLRLGQSYPNYYVTRLAGKFVDTVLSGAGGDELFAGYPWHYREIINSKSTIDFKLKYYNFCQRLVKENERRDFFRSDIYNKIKDYSTFDIFESVFEGHEIIPNKEGYIKATMYYDLKNSLHGLLIVEDKIHDNMGVECCFPLLDDELVDFVLKLPVSYKLNNIDNPSNNDGKKIFRDAMKGLIPKEILKRDKQGFSVPDASWYRTGSRKYVEGILLNKKSRIYEYINPVYVEERVKSHMDGKSNEKAFIWSLLCFEYWLKAFLS